MTVATGHEKSSILVSGYILVFMQLLCHEC